MNTNKKIRLFFDLAERISQESYAEKLKVGCVITDCFLRNILSFGYNGTPIGMNNNAEITISSNELKTKDEVIHAEMNAILKLPLIQNNTLNFFCTHSPCINCAKHILQYALLNNIVINFFYIEDYKNPSGIELFKQEKNYIKIYKYNAEQNILTTIS
jgi:deoxycytidylate deaminase